MKLLPIFSTILFWAVFLSASPILGQETFDPRTSPFENRMVRTINGASAILFPSETAIRWNPALLVGLDGRFNISLTYPGGGIAFKTNYFSFGFSNRRFPHNIDSDSVKQSINSFAIAGTIPIKNAIFRRLWFGTAFNLISTSSEIPGLVDNFSDINSLFDIGFFVQLPSKLKLDFLGGGLNFQNMGKRKFVFQNQFMHYKRNLRALIGGSKYFYRDLFYISVALQNDLVSYRSAKPSISAELGIFDLLKIGFDTHERKFISSLSVNFFHSNNARWHAGYGNSISHQELIFGPSNIVRRRNRESLAHQKYQFITQIDSTKKAVEKRGLYTYAIQLSSGLARIRKLNPDNVPGDFGDKAGSAGGFFLPLLGALSGQPIASVKMFLKHHFSRKNYYMNIDLAAHSYLENLTDIYPGIDMESYYETKIEKKIQNMGLVNEYFRLAEENTERGDYSKSLGLYNLAQKKLQENGYEGPLLNKIDNALAKLHLDSKTELKDKLALITENRKTNLFSALQIAKTVPVVSTEDLLKKVKLISSIENEIANIGTYNKAARSKTQGDKFFVESTFSESLKKYEIADSLFSTLLTANLKDTLKSEIRKSLKETKKNSLICKWKIANQQLTSGNFDNALLHFTAVIKGQLNYNKTQDSKRLASNIEFAIKIQKLLQEARQLFKKRALEEAQKNFHSANEKFHILSNEIEQYWPHEARNIVQSEINLYKTSSSPSVLNPQCSTCFFRCWA